MAKAAAAKPKGASYITPAPPSTQKSVVLKKSDDYTSDGVDDNDVFLLPISDYQVMVVVTILGALVRLFRIYQPTSVVFDEVQ